MSQGFRTYMTSWRWNDVYGKKAAAEPWTYFETAAGGVPAPGPNFVAAAGREGLSAGQCEDRLHELYYRAAFDDAFEIPVRFKTALVASRYVAGGRWGYPAEGPVRHHRVMVIGKHPGVDEVAARKNLVGPSGHELRSIVVEAGGDPSDWYVTNVIRHNHLNPNGGNLETNWKKDCLPLLTLELQRVRPDFVLLLGKEAVQAVLGGRGGKKTAVTFAQARTQVTDLEVPLPDGTVHVAKACACYHPAFTLREPAKKPDLVADVRRFLSLLEGNEYEVIDKNVLHFLVTKESQLKTLVDNILMHPSDQRDVIAVDAEWQGDYPTEPGAYCRTVQFSWMGRRAATVRLHETGGKPAFDPDLTRQAREQLTVEHETMEEPCGITAAVTQLKRLMKSTQDRRVRIVGQNLNADMPWLIHIGLDIRHEFEVAAWPAGEYHEGMPPAWEMTKWAGGFDTILALHAYEETMELKLEAACQRLLGMHRWDRQLQEEKKKLLTKLKLKNDELEGYGDISSDTLEGRPTGNVTAFGELLEDSYSSFDVDGCRRLFDRLNGVDGKPGLLDSDRFGNSCREAFWRSMWACPAFGECHMAGIGVNTPNADRLASHYKVAAERLLEDFRRKIHWPEFNINSSIHKVEFLFGEEYTSKKNKANGDPVRVRPEATNESPEGVCLRLEPYKSTGKRAKLWTEVIRRRQQDYYSVSADKEVLAVLATEQRPLVRQLRDILKLAYLSKSVLRPEVPIWITKKRKEKHKFPYSEETAKLYKKKCACLLGTVELPPKEDGSPGCGCGYKTVDVEYQAPNPELRRVHQFDDEEHGYDGGIFRYIQKDGRVRSQFYQTKETGRASSARPALMNWSKTLEGDYKRIYKDWATVIGDMKYPGPMRAVLQARPGYVLVDCDYTGAELAIAAWMSGDPTMIEHVRRNMLDESDPDYFDIHSSNAIKAFRLVVPDGVFTDEKLAAKLRFSEKGLSVGTTYAEILKTPVGQTLPISKFAVVLIGKEGLRTAAKRVKFGKLYGQQAESMARKIREEGVEVTVEEAAQIDATIDETYPGLAAYFGAAASRPSNEGCLRTCFGRWRRFVATTEQSVQAAQGREAMNFPMQGSVADAMQTAMGHVYRYRREAGRADAYTINLQVHDALVLEVRVEDLDWVVDTVLPTCMSERVVVRPTDHAGNRKGTTEYRLKAPPADVFEQWSVPLTKQRCQELGINEKYGIAG